MSGLPATSGRRAANSTACEPVHAWTSARISGEQQFALQLQLPIARLPGHSFRFIGVCELTGLSVGAQVQAWTKSAFRFLVMRHLESIRCSAFLSANSARQARTSPACMSDRIDVEAYVMSKMCRVMHQHGSCKRFLALRIGTCRQINRLSDARQRMLPWHTMTGFLRRRILTCFDDVCQVYLMSS